MKYIIELEDDIKYLIINGKADNRCYTLVRPVAELEVLNSDYINEHFGELQDEAYQAGMDKAWEAAQKVACKTEAGGMTLDTLQKVFGVISPATIMQSNTAQQAIDKIKAYEDKRSDRIEVGDEVQAPRGKAIVTAVKDDYVHYFYSDGDIGCIEPYRVTKTGKHYDIASILEAMRE